MLKIKDITLCEGDYIKFSNYRLHIKEINSKKIIFEELNSLDQNLWCGVECLSNYTITVLKRYSNIQIGGSELIWSETLN